jgi:hypothetical protein
MATPRGQVSKRRMAVQADHAWIISLTARRRQCQSTSPVRNEGVAVSVALNQLARLHVRSEKTIRNRLKIVGRILQRVNNYALVAT